MGAEELIIFILILNIIVLVLGLFAIFMYMRHQTAVSRQHTTTMLAREWAVTQREDVLIVTDREFGVLYASDSAKKLFPELIHLPAGQKVPEDLIRMIRSDEKQVETDGKIYDRRCIPLDEDGTHSGYALLLLDETDREKALRDSEQARRDAEAANEAKNRFLSNMSHEIRTPMNVTVGMTEMLAKKDISEHKKEEYLKNIRNSSDALISIMNDMADFSELEADNLEIRNADYDPGELVKSLAGSILSRIGGKKIELIFDIDPEIPRVLYGDEQRIRQALISIANNAVKFTLHGYVKLVIKVVQVQVDEITLFFSIRDTGLGFRENDIEKLFTPFHQSGKSGNQYSEGNGLELSIAKQLIELMGGTVHVKSKYREGTEIFFSLTQKIRDSKKSVVRSSDTQYVISAVMKEEEELLGIRKLAMEYGLRFTEYDQAKDSHQRIDYLFTDDEELSFDKAIDYLKDRNCHVVVLQNPMVDVVEREDVTVINKPLYTRTFIQTVDGPGREEVKENETPAAFTAGDATVLIVDDNPMNLKVATGLLSPLGMKIDTASNGEEALDRIHKKHYQLVFMDHMMPVMDGVEATKKLRAEKDYYYTHVPIIALTANAVQESKEIFEEAGMNDFLSKPITQKALFAMTAKWLPPKFIHPLEEETRADETPESDYQTDELDPPEASVTDQIMTGTGTPVRPAAPEPAQQKIQAEEKETPAAPADGDLPGIDRKEGIENCGGEEMWTELLGDYHDMIPDKSALIEKQLAEGDIKNYTIEVHALKSTSRMIGALGLSGEFLELENLGNVGNADALREKTPEVLSHYRKYTEILDSFGHHDSAEAPEIPPDVLKDCVQRIRNSIDTFDLDGADEAMQKIDSYHIPEKWKTEIDRLRSLVADVAMEDVMALCDRILGEM